MKNKIHFLFLLCFLIGCRKEKHEEEIKYIPQDLKDYAYFKVGTWRVYEEETTHERDSVVVFYNADSLISFDGGGGQVPGTYEFFDTQAYSSFDDYGYYYWCNTTQTRNNGSTPVFCDKGKPGDVVGETIIMFNKFYVGNMLGWSIGENITLIEILDTINIGSYKFNNVIKFNNSKNTIYGKNPTNIYISKHIGIVRKEIFNLNKVWNLVNYQINQ